MGQSKKQRRVNKIARLPDEIQTQLNIWLRDGRMTQAAIRAQINTLIDEYGLSDDDKISAGGLSRYSQQFNSRMERYRQAQELSRQWVNKFGEMPQTDIARALIEIGKSQIFDFQMEAMEEGKPMDPKVLGQLALSIKRLQEAQTGSVKLEKEIRKQVAEEAANVAEGAAKAAGLTAEGVAELKNKILGIA
ncbi:DUF3486 family protein [Shewanella algae]|uniref:DUF3486 family protein n=1 Tax=Shewanella algae TaxID=38313 RepID=UPI0031F4B18E